MQGLCCLKFTNSHKINTFLILFFLKYIKFKLALIFLTCFEIFGELETNVTGKNTYINCMQL